MIEISVFAARAALAALRIERDEILVGQGNVQARLAQPWNQRGAARTRLEAQAIELATDLDRVNSAIDELERKADG